MEIQKIKDTKGQIKIRDEQQILQVIRQCKTNKGHTSLGVYLAPDGSSTMQISVMMEKAKKCSQKIRRSYILIFSALLTVKATIMKSHRYLLAALILKE